eukprot:jgi/Ulvmu1/12607/UM092_0038.1
MGYDIPKVKSKHFDKYVAQMTSCESNVYAITGTTTGMGFNAMKVLFSKGAHVMALNRPSERSTTACQTVRDECSESNGKITEISCDLQSFESVRAAGAEVLSQLGDTGLNALVCNAGVMALPDKATGDGYDVQMQTNHLSHFLLASSVFPALQKAAEVSGSARIVGHSSGSRKWPARPAMPNKLEERGITNILCVTAVPGLAASNLQATTAEHGGGMGLQMLMRFAQSAEDGTLPLLECITMAGWPKKKAVEKLCKDEEGKKILWEESEKAVGPFSE